MTLNQDTLSYPPTHRSCKNRDYNLAEAPELGEIQNQSKPAIGREEARVKHGYSIVLPARRASPGRGPGKVEISEIQNQPKPSEPSPKLGDSAGLPIRQAPQRAVPSPKVESAAG